MYLAAATHHRDLILSRCRDRYTIPTPIPTRPRRRHHPRRCQYPRLSINIHAANRPPLRSAPFVNAHLSASDAVRAIIIRRANRHRRSIRGHTRAPSALVVGRFAQNITAALRPRATAPRQYADTPAVNTGGCIGIRAAHGDDRTVRRETDAGTRLVAIGDFVRGVFGPGDAVVAGEVDEAALNGCGLVLAGG